MSNNAVEIYFDYVQNILGVKQVVLERTVSSSEQVVNSNFELLISVTDLNNFAPDESALLYKMIGALQLPAERYAVCDACDAHLFSSPFILSFAETSAELDNGHNVQTFSPRILLKKPELKKQAWADMQKILQKI